jgi:ankyrin repeat protein
MTKIAHRKLGNAGKEPAITNSQLRSVIDKYRRSPEFLFVELNDLNQTGMTGDTLLHAAVTRGELADIEILLSCGAVVNAIGDLGNTPLHEAASRGLVEIVKKLLQCGADINIQNEFGETPLDLAELMERSEVARVLKEHTTRRC